MTGAVAIVLRDKKCSTSYIQRRLSVGYNRRRRWLNRWSARRGHAPSTREKREILSAGH